MTFILFVCADQYRQTALQFFVNETLHITATYGSKISQRATLTPEGRQSIILPKFPENCMKMKKCLARGEGRAPLGSANVTRYLVAR